MAKTLIILPGWGGNSENWRQFTDLFKKDDINVICFNLPCFGGEPCPSKAWGVEEYADFVKQKINNLGNGPVYLMGHSFGGQVAAYLASKEPSIFKGLILSGPAAIRPNRSLKRYIFVKLARLGKVVLKLPLIKNCEPLAKKIVYRLAGSPDYSKTSGIEREIYQKIIRQDLTSMLPDIKMPTLIIWGTKDSYVPLRNGRKINKLISGSKLEIITGGKHGLHIQQPENLHQIVKKFLA